MQEIRVKRGWSYGAGCHWYRSRGAHWFSIHLAPPGAVVGEALALTLNMLEQLAEHGIDADELGFAQRYLAGNLAFQRGTARRRLELAMREQIFGLEPGFSAALPERLAAVTVEQANAAARRRLHPEDALCVVVATADDALPSLRAVVPAASVVPYDSY
jgi:zinc protease